MEITKERAEELVRFTATRTISGGLGSPNRQRWTLQAALGAVETADRFSVSRDLIPVLQMRSYRNGTRSVFVQIPR